MRPSAWVLLAAAALLLCIAPAMALYEDEAGKDDWYFANLGMVKFVQIQHTASNKKAFVASYHGVVAALSLRGDGSQEAGQHALVWRQVLPDDESIKGFQLHKNCSPPPGLQKVLVVSTANRVFVFDLDGNLVWDKAALDSKAVGDIVVILSDQNTVASSVLSTGKSLSEHKIDQVLLSHLHVVDSLVYIVGGQEPSAEQAVIHTATASNDGLSKPALVNVEEHKPFAPSPFSIHFFSGHHYVQLLFSEQSLYVLNLQSGKHATTNLRKLIPDLDPKIEVRFLATEAILTNRAIVANSAGQKWVVSIGSDCKVKLDLVLEKGSAVGANCGSESCQFFAIEGTTASIYEISNSGKFPDAPIREFKNAVPVTPDHVAPMDFVWFWTGAKDAIHMVISRADWSISSVDSHGKLQWRRLDGLSNIQSATFVDLLPTIHSSVSSESTFVQRLRERFQGQVEDAMEILAGLSDIPQSLMSQISSLIPSDNKRKVSIPHLSQADLLKKDRFGLHQMIVLVTGMGNTMVGIHTVGGRVVWERHLDELDFLEYAVLIRRSVSLHPELFVTGVDNYGFPMTFTINPLTGELVSPVTPLSFGVQQVIPLQHLTDAEDRHPVLVIDMDNNAHVFPETQAMHAFVKSQSSERLNFFLASRATGTVSGYQLTPSNASGSEEDENPFKSILTWQIQLKDPIYAMQSAQINTHSAARVNPLEKTISLRHLNPNLVAIATVKFIPNPPKDGDEGSAPSTSAKAGINYVILSIIDTVSGAIVHRTSHKDCSGPVYLAFAENWVVYQFWNERTHKYEVASLEMFDKSGSWGARELNSYALSSSDIQVQQQSYIIHSAVRGLAATKTAQGITEKTLLFGLAGGHILAVSRKFLDPRRPEGQITQEEFAEGLVQYTPILPQHPGAYINYYNLVHRLRNFVTSPAALESTSLVLAYGLDMFYAPIAPNNRYYDRLSHGFSTAIIFIMIAGLSVVTWIFMKLYRQKELRKAWK